LREGTEAVREEIEGKEDQIIDGRTRLRMIRELLACALGMRKIEKSSVVGQGWTTTKS